VSMIGQWQRQKILSNVPKKSLTRQAIRARLAQLTNHFSTLRRTVAQAAKKERLIIPVTEPAQARTSRMLRLMVALNDQKRRE